MKFASYDRAFELFITTQIAPVSAGAEVRNLPSFPTNNRGIGRGRSVWLNTATLSAAAGQAVPQSLINIPPGGFVTATVNLPSTAGNSGAIVVQTHPETYNRGTFIGGSVRCRRDELNCAP
jgi:hypothetical protein